MKGPVMFENTTFLHNLHLWLKNAGIFKEARDILKGQVMYENRQFMQSLECGRKLYIQ